MMVLAIVEANMHSMCVYICIHIHAYIYICMYIVSNGSIMLDTAPVEFLNAMYIYIYMHMNVYIYIHNVEEFHGLYV